MKDGNTATIEKPSFPQAAFDAMTGAGGNATQTTPDDGGGKVTVELKLPPRETVREFVGEVLAAIDERVKGQTAELNAPGFPTPAQAIDLERAYRAHRIELRRAEAVKLAAGALGSGCTAALAFERASEVASMIENAFGEDAFSTPGPVVSGPGIPPPGLTLRG